MPPAPAGNSSRGRKGPVVLDSNRAVVARQTRKVISAAVVLLPPRWKRCRRGHVPVGAAIHDEDQVEAIGGLDHLTNLQGLEREGGLRERFRRDAGASHRG